MKDRRALLSETLDALEAQDYDDFEVIVVDDGSRDGSGAMAAAREVHGRPVRVLQGGGEGAVHARLVGIESARGDVLAFTDSDCLPQPAWLKAAMQAIDRGADMVNGLTEPARPMLPLERSMYSGYEGLYPTCNMLYRRETYDRVGGFDISLADRWGCRIDQGAKGDGFGEDTELAWRVIHAGADAAFVPEALVLHAVFSMSLREHLSRTLRVAGFAAMVRELPELRATLFKHHWQLGFRSRAPIYVLALACAARQREIAVGSLGWWAALRLHELRRFPVPWRRRIALLPMEMGVDLLTAGSLVVGSVRARSVAL